MRTIALSSIIFLSIGATSTLGCRYGSSSDVNHEKGPNSAPEMSSSISSETPGNYDEDSNVRGVEATDEEMNAAIVEARASFEFFVDQLNNPKPSQSGFFVKVRLQEEDAAEHIWLGELLVNGNSLSGTIQNEPHYLTIYTFGQRIKVTDSILSDWMYVENGILQGGYSFRLLRSRMSPEERAAFDADLGFKIE